MKSDKTCKYCGALLEKRCIALNKKLLNPGIEEFSCLRCLADDLGCEEEDLRIKIEEFMESDCTLFR